MYRHHCLPEQPNASMRCSFCKKTRAQVFKIVLGPNVSICDECVELCEEILAEERLKVKAPQLPPCGSAGYSREIYSYLNDYVIGQTRRNAPWRWRCTTTTSASTILITQY